MPGIIAKLKRKFNAFQNVVPISLPSDDTDSKVLEAHASFEENQKRLAEFHARENRNLEAKEASKRREEALKKMDKKRKDSPDTVLTFPQASPQATPKRAVRAKPKPKPPSFDERYGPDHVSMESIPNVNARITAFDTSTRQNIKELMRMISRTFNEDKVVCMTEMGRLFSTLDKIPLTDLTPLQREKAKSWTSLTFWEKFVKNVFIDEKNATYFGHTIRKLSSGTYNYVFSTTPDTPVDDANLWPPQLASISDKLVFRCTQIDSLDVLDADSDASHNVYHNMDLRNMLYEIALTMYMSGIGVAPKIRAAVRWSFHQMQQGIPGWGSCIVMDHAGRNFWRIFRDAEFIDDGVVENISLEVVNLIFLVSAHGFIDFDCKPGNCLYDSSTGNVSMIDFDSCFMKFVSDDVIGLKGRFFLMLLLFMTHIRATMDTMVANSAARIFQYPLMELWTELHNEWHYIRDVRAGNVERDQAKESFGNGVELIHSIPIRDDPSAQYNDDILYNSKSINDQLSLLMTSMVYEYVLKTKYGAARGYDFHIRRGGKSWLAPRMLMFSLFYDSDKLMNAPESWRDSLQIN